MKRIILLIITMMLIVTGCESETATDGINQDLLKAKEKISELDKKNQTLINQIEELKAQIERDKSKNIRLEQLANDVTRLEKFECEILSTQINRPPFDSVVYIANVPEKLDEQEVLVIRSAIQFAGTNFSKVSIWKDRNAAIKYVNGDYDPEESVLGWSGFDQRFGSIDNTSNPPTLRHSFSRDDGQMIEFGKYSYE